MSADAENHPTQRVCQWDIDGLSIAGLAWGPQDGIPILALHGWMDHAASFSALAPHLTGCHVVAPDLSGHGLSAHRAAHASYNIWDDLPQILEIIERLGWERPVLLGHSRGAIVATLFAATFPERVRALVALDSILPDPAPQGSFVSTLRASIDQNIKQKQRTARMFKTREDYLARRCRQGNSAAVAEALADRALKQLPDCFQMRADLRMFARSAVRLSRNDLETVLRSLRSPVLNIWAKDSKDSASEATRAMIALCRRLIPDYISTELPGDHHFHLAPQGAEAISDLILRFLVRNRTLIGAAD